MCYSAYQENLNYFLQEYYALVYNPKKNRTIKKFPMHRELKFEIKDRVYKSGKQPEINAYSVYDTEYDRIFITESLVDMMSDATLRSKFNEDRAAWMFNVELYLCAYHELGHLLVGHCQLCENMRLAAVETEEEKSGLDISVKTGKPQRGCQPDENTHRHPPSLARGYSTGLVFMEHIRRYFKISGDKDEFMKIFLSGEEMFGGKVLTQEEFQKIYKYVLDGTFETARKRVKNYWMTDVGKMVKEYSRISVGLFV